MADNSKFIIVDGPLPETGRVPGLHPTIGNPVYFGGGIVVSAIDLTSTDSPAMASAHVGHVPGLELQLIARHGQRLPQAAPVGQEYVDPFLFETGHFESREEYEELSRTAKIKPRTRA